MRPITEEFIHEVFACYEGTTCERKSDAWLVTTSWGRKTAIHDYYIDFYGSTILMDGENWEDLKQYLFELMSMAVETWGVVSLVSLRGSLGRPEIGTLWMWAKIWRLPVELPFHPFTSTQVKRFFGHAKAKRTWGGWKISASNGMSAVIGQNPKRKLMVVKAVGGSEILQAAILLVNEVQGHVIAGGDRENILACLAFGPTLDIAITPELYITSRQYFRVGIAAGAFVLPIGIGVGMSAHSLVLGALVAWGLQILIATAYRIMFQRNGPAQAQARGQALKGNYTSGSRRKSNIDEAGERGMLL